MQVLGIFCKYSPKRHEKLEQAIAEADKEGYLNKKIKPLCKTPWVERHTAFEDLNQLYKPQLNCLESIQSNSDPNNRFDAKPITEAAGLLKQLRNLSFIISFHTCHYLFDFTKKPSKQLQGPTTDIAKAYDMVSLVTEQLDSFKPSYRIQCDFLEVGIDGQFQRCLDSCAEKCTTSNNALQCRTIIYQRNTLESQFSYHFWMACYKNYTIFSRENQKIASRL